MLGNGVTKLLYSYFWVSNMRRESFLRKLKEENPHLSLILDSGAYTYSQQSLTHDLPEPRLFFKRYQQYIRDYGELFDQIFELDIDGTEGIDVDSDQVASWTSRLLDEFPDLKIVPVYHSWRGVEEWDQYLEDPRIKGMAIGRSPPLDGQIGVYLDRAHQRGITVHGLAFTKYNTSLKYLPFDSVDSSSWSTGQRYGNFHYYNNGNILNLTVANRGKMRVRQLQQYIKARGCDPKKIIAGDRMELLQCNIRTWILVSQRLELMRKQQKRMITEENPKMEVVSQPQPRTSLFDLRSFMLPPK